MLVSKNSELTISYLQDRFKHELVNYDNSNGLEQLSGNIYGVAGIFGIFIDWLQGKIKASPEELGEAIGKFLRINIGLWINFIFIFLPCNFVCLRYAHVLN